MADGSHRHRHRRDVTPNRPAGIRQLPNLALMRAVLCALMGRLEMLTRIAKLTATAALALGVFTPPATGAPDTTRAPEVDYDGVISQLRSEIPDLMAQAGAVGLTVALVDGNQVVWTEGFGYRDREQGKPVTSDTLFHIGSLSKTFAAITVMQLVEQGLVNLDAPLSTYVPDFRLAPRYRDNVISVRSVLDHHSGIPGDVFNGLITAGKPDPGFRDWLVSALAAMPPERPVDTQWAYNNSGFVLLQNLVENVTHEDFDSYTQRTLFGPMAMTSSTFDDRKASNARLTHNYSAAPPESGQPATLMPREYVNGWTAGSITSSANDMANYLRTLLAGGRGPDGRILRESTLNQMWTKQVSTPLDIGVLDAGLGFALRDFTMDWAGRVIWHDGATVWNLSMLKLLPDSDLGVFVSVNTAQPAGLSAVVAQRILSAAYTAKTGRPQPDPSPLPASEPIPVDPARVNPLVGFYGGGATLLQVATTPTGITVTKDVGTATPTSRELAPYADGWFRPAEGSGSELSFRVIEGKRLMVTRLPTSGAPVELIGGEQVPPAPVPPAWQARLGHYTAVNADPNVDGSLVARTFDLGVTGGQLTMTLSNEWGVQPIAIGKSGDGFTFGMGTALGRAKGDALIPSKAKSGAPVITYLGVRYVRTS
jgi:CubicO group peptidase (beta-lactamase class C family)